MCQTLMLNTLMTHRCVTPLTPVPSPSLPPGGYDKEVRKNGLVRYSSNLEVRTDSPLVKATASVDHRDGLKRTTIDVVYTLAGPRHRVRFNGQMKDAQSRQLYTLNMDG